MNTHRAIHWPSPTRASLHAGISFTYLLSLLVGAGCTQVSSKPVASDGSGAHGVTYALPKPVLRVVPQGDGTIDVGIEYLPDSDHTYWLKTDSYFSNHKAQIMREEGMLTKLQWSSNAAAVPADAIKASGEVTKSVLDAELSAKRDALTTLKTAQEAVVDAEQNVKLDELALKEAQTLNPPDPVKTAAAQHTLDQDNIKLGTAREKLKAEQERVAEKPISPAGVSMVDVTPGAIGGTLVEAPTLPQATITHKEYTISGGINKPQPVWGPALFEIDERVIASSKRPTVVLHSMTTNVNPWEVQPEMRDGQQHFPTAAAPHQPIGITPQSKLLVPDVLNFLPGDLPIAVLTPASAQVVVKSTGKVEVVDENNYPVSGDRSTATVGADGKVTLKIDPSLPQGKYRVRFNLIGPDHLPLGTVEISVTQR